MKLFIGTYTEPILFGTGEVVRGHGEGLYACDFDGTEIRILQVLKMANPSYLTLHPNGKKIFAVNEGKEFRGRYGGGITEIDLSPDGRMETAAAYPTHGTDPCHVAISPDRTYLGVANFGDGSVTAFPLDENGRISGEGKRFQHRGSGPNTSRQKGPHAHSVLFDRHGRAWVPDLGADTLFCYDLRSGTFKPESRLSFPAVAGSGPRFGVFSSSGRLFFLVHELSCHISSFKVSDQGEMLEIQKISVPEGSGTEDVTCADLHLSPDERFLYASVRGEDTLAVFSLEKSGLLHLVQRVSTCGHTPRNFAVSPDGSLILVGNQDSDSISIFRREKDGILQLLRTQAFPMPVCIRFAD